MKLLIAVKTCVSDILKGNDEAIRGTYGLHLPGNVDLRFFLGSAKPGPLEAEEPNFQKDYANLCRVKPHMIRPEPVSIPKLRDDEIVLNAPDTYSYISHKQREMCRWFVKTDYDVMFRVDTDTFIRVKRLLGAGFEDQDYVGEASDLSGGLPGYAFGGCGVWLSRRSCELLQDAPLTCLADDVWISDILKQHSIYVNHSAGFAYDMQELHPNNIITVHLGGKTGSYNNREMYRAYRLLGE